MYQEFLDKKVNVVVSSRSESMLEYNGILVRENEETIELKDVKIGYLMLNFQKGFFGNNINVYKDGVDKVVINKKYIISCNN